jgi:hypothetical protein
MMSNKVSPDVQRHLSLLLKDNKAFNLSVQQLKDNTVVKLNLIIASFHSRSINTGNCVGAEGATILSEALKSNTSLTSLLLSRNGALLRFVLTQYR